MKYFILLLKLAMAVLFVTFIGCQSEPDFEVLRSEIMDIQSALIDAHLNKNIEFFIRDVSDEFISLSNGKIRYPTIDEIKSQFGSYLGNTKFAEYRYLREPIICFSRDGSVAWSIVQVKVAGERTMDDGNVQELDFICAWITLYERHDGKWIRCAEVSNF